MHPKYVYANLFGLVKYMHNYNHTYDILDIFTIFLLSLNILPLNLTLCASVECSEMYDCVLKT